MGDEERDQLRDFTMGVVESNCHSTLDRKSDQVLVDLMCNDDVDIVMYYLARGKLWVDSSTICLLQGLPGYHGGITGNGSRQGQGQCLWMHSLHSGRLSGPYRSVECPLGSWSRH